MSTDAARRLARLSSESTEVKLSEDYGIGPALLCPRCGSEYLHHGRVTVFDRGEDDEATVVTTVKGGLTATHLLPSCRCGNPSGRRDGVAIAFYCEQCGDAIELTIAQHKGCTYLAWRFAASGSDDGP
jgi:hypothetical protein